MCQKLCILTKICNFSENKNKFEDNVSSGYVQIQTTIVEIDHLKVTKDPQSATLKHRDSFQDYHSLVLFSNWRYHS